MKRKRLVATIFIGLFLFSMSVEARRVKTYQCSSITLARIIRIWNSDIYKTVFSKVKSEVRDMSIEETNSYILQQLNEIGEKDSFTDEEAAFLIVALKQEAALLGWQGKENDFLTQAVLPRSISSEEDVGHFLIQHLLWFYNYRQEKKHIIGIDFEKEVKNWYKNHERIVTNGSPVSLFHGTSLGIVYDVIFKNGGELGPSKGYVCLSVNPLSAESYADPGERQSEYETEASDSEWQGAPFKSLAGLNSVMSFDAQKLPNKFSPVILKFKEDLSTDPECIQMVSEIPTLSGTKQIPLHEFTYLGKVSLNMLTFECKEDLVNVLKITKAQSWMDEEWKKIIEGEE